MKNILRSCFMLLALFGATRIHAQVPIYNSLPSASATIFLDFDGQTVENTSWNYAGPIFCASSGLTTAQITTVFNRVAEDYRPFNINITTDSTKYFAAPATKRQRVILTVTSDWYGSAGGVSFVGSFTWGDNTPAFVFTQLLGFSEKYVGEAASHEAGHTLGLYHQALYDASCVKISDYNSGVGSGEIGWAPIMGVGYYRNFTLWNNGPNSYGCNTIQSDLAVITTTNGFTYRSDDYPNTFNQASSLPFTSSQFSVNGVIEQSTDMDMFKFVLPQAQHFVLNATPYNIGTGNTGSNLDMQVTLFNSSQTQLNVYNPGTLLNSVIDTILNTGTYYLKIEGKGNMYAPNYASLGSYSLQGTESSATLPLRSLVLQGELVNDKHKLNWVIDADEQVIEQILEISTDGRTFHSLVQPGNADRTYLYQPSISSAVQYRLKATFDNGHIYYSNIVTLRNINNDLRPKLVSNLVNNSLLITSPGTFNYSIYDLNGKMTAKGSLTKGMNNVSTGNTSGGMYMIRFADENNQWTDKFVRQ
jgi:hypothetical protein